MSYGPDVPRCGFPRRGQLNKETGERTGVGEPCGKVAGAGTDHLGFGPCSWHGGQAPPAMKKYGEEKALAEARQGLAKLGDARPLEDVSEAYDALLSVGGRLDALVRGLEQKVGELREIAVTHPIRGSQVKAELTVYLTAVRVLTEIISAIGRLNIDERKTRIAEAQAQVMYVAMDATLRSLALSPERHQHARSVLSRELAAARNGN